MDKTTLIVVIVFGSIVGLVLIVWAARSISRALHTQTVPPPPPQALRHHAQAAASRPQTMFQPTLGVPAPPFSSSRASLLSGGKASPSIEGTQESGSDLMLQSPMDPLGNPQPSFHLVSPSSSSFHSEDVSPTNDTTFSHDSGSTSAHQRRAQMRSAGSRTSSIYGHSRPESLISHNRHSVRGLPHGPFSNVQVVLPAPLSVTPNARGRPVSTYSNHRLSMVDTWVPSSSRAEKEQPLVKSKSASHLAEPRSSSSSANSGKLRASSSRRSSTSSVSPSPSPSPLSNTLSADELPAPPVPRIPSIYSTPNFSTPEPGQQRMQPGISVSTPPALPPKQ